MYNINPTNLLYENGETTNRSEGKQLFVKQIGHLEITSGHIVACDPLFQKVTNLLRGRLLKGNILFYL
ncbi:hypothetical protein [Bacillus safensis]|uniref:hypothetical protein n=1 Tax=Bacillus safensis TaxID=561879 RepID=UPI00384FC951